MTKRLGLNLILLLVIAVLAGVVYFEPGVEQNEPPNTLLPLTAAQVEKIQLQHGTAQVITIERVGNGWMIVAPIRIAASDFRVDSLLKLMTVTSYSHFSVSARPLSAFGLENPLGNVSFNEQVILFGANEPLNQRRYVLVGDQVHLINDYYFYQSQLLLTALVDMALLPSGQTLTQISLPGLLLRQDQGDWQLQQKIPSGSQPELSMDDINGLVKEWRYARAVQVSRYQSDVAEANIELVFADGETMVLEILAREPELILGRRELGLRYHFSVDQADRLLTLPQRSSNLESMPESKPVPIVD